MWKEEGAVKPILKALKHQDPAIRREAVEALGDMVRSSVLSGPAAVDACNRILSLATSLSSADGALESACVYALRGFESSANREYFHRLLQRYTTEAPQDPHLLEWVITGLCECVGNGETCCLMIQLAKEGRLPYRLRSHFWERARRLMKSSIDAGGIESDVLATYCQSALAGGVSGAPECDREAGFMAKRALSETFNEHDQYAREQVRTWLQSTRPAVREYARSFLGTDEELPPMERELTETLKAVAAGEEHATVLAERVERAGAQAIPVLRRFLESDLHGREGRAAVIGLRKLPPELSLPLVIEAFKSDWEAVRYYAAEYLVSRPSADGKAIAHNQLPKETDADVRRLLEMALSGQ